MIYLLDTNACIQFLNNRLSPVTQKITMAPAEHICLCSLVQMELYYGAYRSSQSERNLAKLARFFSQFRILPFDKSSGIGDGENPGAIGR